MKDREWLESLKEGDLVILRPGFGGSTQTHVQRTTKTQIIVEKTKFRRVDGFMVGDVYVRGFIEKPTPARLEIIKRNKLIDRIKSLNWNNYSAPALAQVLSLLSKQNEKKTRQKKRKDVARQERRRKND